VAKNRWIFGWVDGQGCISIGKKAKEFLGIQTGEFVWLIVEPTGKFDRKELSQRKPIEEIG